MAEATQQALRTKLTSADHITGDIWWVDLASTDVARSRDYYSAVFGWSFDEAAEGFGDYQMARVGDAGVAGIMPQNEQMQEMGAPSAWCPYINVDDAKATIAKAKQLGATIFVEAMQVGELGWMGVIADPTGAVFGIWQPLSHTGADLINSPGSLSWTECRTGDIAAAKAFYTALFGWTTNEMDMGGRPYTLFMNGETQSCGLFGAPDGMPSHWGVTFAVASLDTAIETTKAQGGALVMGPMQIPFGTVAEVTDPTGAFVGLIELSTPNQG